MFEWSRRKNNSTKARQGLFYSVCLHKAGHAGAIRTPRSPGSPNNPEKVHALGPQAEGASRTGALHPHVLSSSYIVFHKST